MKPKKIFFLCYFFFNWVLFPADSSMFFWVNRKCLIPVNTGSDWPFFVTCSGLQRNHYVFLALGLGKRVWACRLIPFSIGCFPYVFCAPSVIKRLIRCLLHGNNSMAKHGSDSLCASSGKKKFAAKYKPEWATDLQFICHSDKRPMFAYCRVCNTHINVAHGAVRFLLLACLMTTLSVIAHSNAGSERMFLMCRNIDTDSRSQLGNNTLRALLSCKIKTDDPCYSFVPEKDLLK